MACFLVPMTEAILVTIVKNVVEKKERKAGIKVNSKTGLSWSHKLSWLNKLLWGGVLLLGLEHFWHGEIVLRPPFLTAMNNPADAAAMLNEIAIVGTSMSIFVTLVWGIMVFIAENKAKDIPAKMKTGV